MQSRRERGGQSEGGHVHEVVVRRAESAADFDRVRALCRAWPEWQLKTYPELREEILFEFEPESYARRLAALETIHARPKGAVLLAELEGQAVGCVMYLEMAPGVAEVKRLFVDEAGRGHGIGRALLEEMFARMRADGYRTARFSSARHLSHARRLYESLGFRDIPAPEGYPDFVYFMERPL